jgi:initiation factor 1A
MVKNVTGGSKHKGQARKNVISRGGGGALRTVQDEGEMYAQVEKMMGGANCHVMCIDGELRMCHIRGKFRGRGKRDNRIAVGTWVMVGARDYESESSSRGKLQNCDLLEVYRDGDKERLRSSVKLDWSAFVARDDARSHVEGVSSDLVFSTEAEEESENLVLESLKVADEEGESAVFSIDGEDITVDDI